MRQSGGREWGQAGLGTLFISHSSRDRWIAKQLDRGLREADGVETFLDEKDIEGGDRITDRVKAQF